MNLKLKINSQCEIATILKLLERKLLGFLAGKYDILFSRRTFVELQSNKNQSNSNQYQSGRNLSISEKIPIILSVHFDLFVNQTDKYKNNIPKNMEAVNIAKPLGTVNNANLGDISTVPNHPAERFWQIPAILMNQNFLSFFPAKNLINTNLAVTYSPVKNYDENLIYKK